MCNTARAASGAGEELNAFSHQPGDLDSLPGARHIVGTAGSKQGTSALSGSISMASSCPGKGRPKAGGGAGTPSSLALFLDWRALSEPGRGDRGAWRWGTLAKDCLPVRVRGDCGHVAFRSLSPRQPARDAVS